MRERELLRLILQEDEQQSVVLTIPQMGEIELFIHNANSMAVVFGSHRSNGYKKGQYPGLMIRNKTYSGRISLKRDERIGGLFNLDSNYYDFRDDNPSATKAKKFDSSVSSQVDTILKSSIIEFVNRWATRNQNLLDQGSVIEAKRKIELNESKITDLQKQIDVLSKENDGLRKQYRIS